MRKALRITAWVLGVIITIVVIAMLVAHLFIGRYIRNVINEKFANNDTVMVHVDDIEIGRIHYLTLLMDRRLEVSEITLVHPTISVLLTEPKEPHSLSDAEKNRDERREKKNERMQEILAEISKYVDGCQIDRFSLRDAHVEVRSARNHMHVVADNINVSSYDLRYTINDPMPFTFDTARYEMSIGQIEYLSEDSLTAISCAGIRNANNGPLCVGATHIRNTVDPWDMCLYREPGPQNWSDVRIREIRTSDIPLRTKLLNPRFTLDSVYVDIDSISAFTDLRQKSPKPLPMPQEGLLKIKQQFFIPVLRTRIRALEADIALTDDNCGTLHLRKVYAVVNNITADRGATIYANLSGMMGQGKMTVKAAFAVNQRCNWSLDIDARDAELKCLNDFMCPIMGMNLGGNLFSLQTSYKGDRDTASGTFCMLYDGLTARVEEDANPAFEIISKMRKVINTFVITCVPHSNPRKAGAAPSRYMVKAKRDPYRPAPFYLISPLLDGTIKTLLPGHGLRSKIHEPKPGKHQRHKLHRHHQEQPTDGK